MNLPMKWLSDFTDVSDIDIKSYCDRMTATGSKVEGYEILASDIENVVVGRILSTEKHPDADKLTVTKTDVGGDAPIQVITAATNIFPGAVVPVALVGAKLPGGVNIKKGKLRGLDSEGMFCSIAELSLTTHDMPDAIENGILILGEEYGDKIGCDIKDVLMLNDTVVEFEITSNRPDCLSVIGLARETAISFDRGYSIPEPEVKPLSDGDNVENYIKVDIEAPELCRRYSAAVVKNVKIAPSPLWLRMRLRAAGVRPINNIVDITNYVMLEYGQPMHAFDYKCLDGAHIIVREAAEGENFKSLDDIDHVLKSGMLVISDEKKAVALAGVMGGANSEITDSTATVVFESANFKGAEVRVAAKSLGMRTESSSRFEKGMDPEITMKALKRACELVQLLGAGDVVDGTIDVYPNKKQLTKLPLDVDKINNFLGVNLSGDYMAKVLTDLGCAVENGEIAVPSWRDDLGCMNDIAEEIIRIYGYDTIEATRFKSSLSAGGRTEKQQFTVDLSELLCGMGASEIQTFSFISPKYYDKMAMAENDVRRNSVVIANPLGEDTSIMRTTGIPSMLEILSRNSNYGNEAVSLFEFASVYTPREKYDDESENIHNLSGVLPKETVKIMLGSYGTGDFYTVKGMIENILSFCGIEKAVYAAKSDDPTFHPGRCASVSLSDGTAIGIFGELHPAAAENYGFSKKVYIAEIDYETIFANRNTKKQYTPLPKFPAMTRDFSFVCDESLEVGTIEDAMLKSGVKMLEDIKLFDIYRGHQLGDGKKSVSFKITLRAADRTLTDDEADSAVKKILSYLEKTLGITLRA